MRQLHTRWVGIGVLSLGLVATSLMPVFAQEGRGERGERGDRERRQGRQVDREAMQQRMQERMQQQREQLRQSLDMSEEHFSAVQPLIESVQGYQREQMTAGRGGRGFGRGGGDADSLSDEGQALGEAARALREAIASESISTEDLEARLEAVRVARAQLAQALEQARNELREVLTLRQEAVLVARGLLD